MNKKQLETKIADLKAGIESPSTDEKYKPQLRELLKQAEDELAALSKAETPAEKKTVEKKAESTVEKAKKLVSKVKAEPEKAAGGVKKSAKQLIDDCRKLLSRNKQEKKTAAKRIEKRKKAGKPVELTPSETVSKTAKAVSSKVISIKEKTDKGLPAGEVNKLSSGIIATIRATIKGILATGDKRAFLDDLVDEINSLKSNLPKAAEFGGNVDFNSGAGMFARGGKMGSAKPIINSKVFKVKDSGDYDQNIWLLVAEINQYIASKTDNPLLTITKKFDKSDMERIYVDNATIRVWDVEETKDGFNVRVSVFMNDEGETNEYATGGKTDEEKGGMAEYFAKKKDETFEIEDENAEMLYSQVKEIKHHAEEILSLMCAKTKVESWVVAKGERSSTDLSDIYHYLDGRKEMFCCGGSLEEGGELEGAGMFAKGGSVEDNIADRYARLTDAEAKRLDELQKKVNINEQTESEDAEYDRLVHKYRGWEYKEVKSDGSYAKGGSVGEERFSVYELANGQPTNFYNEERNKFIWGEPTKATLYTKEEAENKRQELLKPRTDFYQRTGKNYKELHIGDLFEKGLLKYAKGGGLSRDRMFVSQQEWEKNYKRKTAGRRYKHEFGGAIVDYTDGTIADPRFDINSPVFEKGGAVEGFEVFIDRGDDLGTETLATFDTKKEAEKFMFDYLLQNPDAKLNIDTLTSDYLKHYAKGGGLSRDRMFVSQQKWEKNYKRKTAGRRYKHEEGGFVNEGAGMFANGGSVESLYEKLIKEYEKDGWGKISSFDRFLEAKKESALEKGDAELYNKLCDVVYMYEKDFYAKGGEINKKGYYTGKIVDAEVGSVMVGNITGYRGDGDPVYDVHSFGELRKDIREKKGELSGKKIKELLKKKYAEGGFVLGEDTVGRVDDPSFSDSSTY